MCAEKKLASGSNEFGENLVKVLDLTGKHVNEIKIICRAGDAVEVDIRFLLEHPEADEVIAIFKKYNLVEVDADNRS